MSDVVIVSLISMVGSLLAAIIGLFNNILARKNAKDIEETKITMGVLEKNTNSMKDALVQATGQAAYGKGLQVGTDAGIVKGTAQAEALEAARQEPPQ